jgi:nitrate/nitrite transporter NarK
VAGLLICAGLLPSTNLANDTDSMLVLSGAFFAIGMVTSNIWAISQTLAGPGAAGTWTGVQNSIGNLGGVVSPIVTAWIVARTGSFFLAFVAASISLLLAALVYLVMLGPIVPIWWQGKETWNPASNR